MNRTGEQALGGRAPAGRQSAGARTSGTSGAPDPTGAGDEVGRANDLALRQLAVRARSRAELAGALRRKGIPDEVADGVLARLTELGLIDDAAFASDWVQARAGSRGRRALAFELRAKGVDAEVTGAAVEAVGADQEWASACALVERRSASMAGLAPEVRARRLVGALARRGFSSEVCRRVLDTMHEGRPHRA